MTMRIFVSRDAGAVAVGAASARIRQRGHRLADQPGFGRDGAKDRHDRRATHGCGVGPTALAVRTADAAGITLAAIARADGFEIFTHPHRIAAAQHIGVAEATHVA